MALFAMPMELTARCAKCHDPWFGKERCEPRSSGPSCGASCTFDHAGNCYLTAPCGSEIKPNTIPVLDHLAAMSVALNSDALEGIGEAARGELIEDGMLNVSDTRRAIPAVGMRDAPYSRPISIVFLYLPTRIDLFNTGGRLKS